MLKRNASYFLFENGYSRISETKTRNFLEIYYWYLLTTFPHNLSGDQQIPPNGITLLDTVPVDFFTLTLEPQPHICLPCLIRIKVNSAQVYFKLQTKIIWWHPESSDCMEGNQRQLNQSAGSLHLSLQRRVIRHCHAEAVGEAAPYVNELFEMVLSTFGGSDSTLWKYLSVFRHEF